MELPIVECLDEIVRAVERSVPVVLKAPPGAGKTTGVPRALLDQGLIGNRRLLLVEPRRLAARAAASRLAYLDGTKLGDRIGYQVRFDNRATRNTNLVAVTTGVLLRRLQSDPLLEQVSCVVLDEFHERSVEADLALGMLQRIRTTMRPELKIVVMSATLDPQPIAEFLGDAGCVESQGRSFPVEVAYVDSVAREPVEQQIQAHLPEVLKSTEGHVLVFLPGLGEIRRTRRAVETLRLPDDNDILELYGDLPTNRQNEVLAASDRRKIILATNVAETSITIDGVTAVIDSGLARVMQFDARVGIPKLQLEPISRGSAEQRAGRAGRTEPGVCLRLWPAATHRARRERDTPEIQRCDFSGTLLSLAAWGERDVFAFPWLTPPPMESVAQAGQLLEQLDAIDDDGRVTLLGRQMVSIPLPPRLSRFMIEATKRGAVDKAALAAALLTERDPFRGPKSGAQSAPSGCDIADRVERLIAILGGDRSGEPDASAVRQVQRAADQIQRVVDTVSVGSTHSDASEGQPLTQALLAAYPDRVARRRDDGSDRGLMVGGRGVRLHPSSNVRHGDLFLCIDVDAKGAEATVRSASTIDPSWLDQRLIREVEDASFDTSLEAVVARRRRYYLDLLLQESPIRCVPNAETAEVLASNARSSLQDLLRCNGDVARFVDRVRFLSAAMPELDLPLLDDTAIDQILIVLCQTRTSIAELQSAPWLSHLCGRYDYKQMQLIDKHAPSRMMVPSGNTMAIRYAVDKPPIIEVRIQEIFGWQQTPRIADGKITVQLHLLGPNYRPQQITEDLANFWRDTYVRIRKELRRRYPKHHWPEDPTTATATRNGLKPRS